MLSPKNFSRLKNSVKILALKKFCKLKKTHTKFSIGENVLSRKGHIQDLALKIF